MEDAEAKGLILKRLEAEKLANQNKDHSLIRKIILSVLKADPKTLPKEVKIARQEFIDVKRDLIFNSGDYGHD